jgi:hypothetical protein
MNKTNRIQAGMRMMLPFEMVTINSGYLDVMKKQLAYI